MMLSAMSATGTDASEAVRVGDTTFDMQMGKAAGARTIGVSWGYHEVADLRAAGADVIIDRYDDLDGAIAEVLK
jgi:phosphoglycolate phosphatase